METSFELMEPKMANKANGIKISISFDKEEKPLSL
jgi:hypothetical protein